MCPYFARVHLLNVHQICHKVQYHIVNVSKRCQKVVNSCQKVCKMLTKKLSKNRKIFQKVPQKIVKKVVKNLSTSCKKLKLVVEEEGTAGDWPAHVENQLPRNLTI
jgi:ABC-type uncharacterized transport system permease subunit